jgi:glutamate dehydrogenase
MANTPGSEQAASVGGGSAPRPQQGGAAEAAAPAPRRASHRADRRGELVRRVEAHDAWPDEDTRARAVFMAQGLVRRADDDFLNRHPADALPGHLRHALAAVAVRAPDQILVGVRQPSLASHGYQLPMAVLETCMGDQPFIVDTIKMVLRRLGVRVLGTMNMILPVERDDAGRLVALRGDNPASHNESFTCHLLGAGSVEGRKEALREAVQAQLERAARVVRDFPAMRKLVSDVVSTLRFCAETRPQQASEFLEAAALCDWLVADNFVFLGAYGFDVEGRPTGRLGLGRYDAAARAGVESDPALAFCGDAPLVSIQQSRIDAPVHREARMQEVRVRLFDADGAPDGGVVFQGLFTYAALTSPSSKVPVLRMRLGRMVAGEDLVPRSHRFKLFTSFFDRLPLSYTFAADDAELVRLISEAIDVDFGGEPRVHALRSAAGTVAHVFVIVAAGRYGEALRLQVQEAIRRAYGADHVSFRLLSGKTEAAIWHYLVQARGTLAEADVDGLSEQVRALVSPWVERMRELLRSAGVEETEIDRLTLRLGDSLPEDYRLRVEASHLAEDLRALDAVLDGRGPRLLLRRDADDLRDGTARLLYYTPTDSALTDILPVIDHFGLRVLGEVTTPIDDARGKRCYFEAYRIDLGASEGPALMEHGPALLEALRAVLDARMSSSSLNQLLLPARLDWRQLQVLRAYIGYARQLGVAFPPNIVQQVLHDQAAIARTLIDLFDARFDPSCRGAAGEHCSLPADAPERAARIAAVEAQFRAQLDAVSDAVEDKILRMFFNLIGATIRTNFFQRPEVARGLSFKFRCAEVELMRDPRPLYEIYVYDPRVEGIHLRGGPVARGGLRWSDRLDDYRTEILGLMLTQMVKNTLIVPVGSKGGFVVKVSERDEGARRRLADELYKVFIHGLLDVTDNIVEGEPVRPERVVTWDGPDPYLVVAADKGTAHLSDTANAIAQERGFWLGDAFASGGTNGYDHKRYGITARGAWVCVQRHFREMGVDTQRDAITAVGIGDMSGDVFGNGMLLTRTLRLKGAFNHRHIFLDPDPDPEASFAERERLFKLPRSGWGDYDRAKISRGGGVYERGAKRIELSPEARELLGLDRGEVSGEELVRLLLTLDVHLLWNGGIGTYVKASAQSHADAGDKSNDGVRVDARQLRCKVVGEGGNLGFTQAGRVEYAQLGGRINTDAVDNSGGVDLSDHEVNLKILFAPLLQQGSVDQAARDKVLFAIDEAVCDLVLANNARHALGLSLTQARTQGSVLSFDPVIAFLCDQLGLDRELQSLPSSATLHERHHAGQTLTRPELARITAFAKMWIYQALAEDQGSSADVAGGALAAYFPAEICRDWQAAIDGHMLRHPIVCTVWSNELVDYGGPRLLAGLALEYGRGVVAMANAWALASDLLGAGRLRRVLGELPAETASQLQIEALLAVEQAVASLTRTLLSTFPGEELREVFAQRDAITAFVGEARAELLQALPAVRRTALRARAASWSALGLPRELAEEISRLGSLGQIVQVYRLATRTGLGAKDATAVWMVSAHRSGLGDLLEADEDMPADRWVAAARACVFQDLSESLLGLALDVAATVAPARPRPETIERAVDRDPELAAIWSMARQIQGERDRLPAMVVLSNRLRNRLRRSEAGDAAGVPVVG